MNDLKQILRELREGLDDQKQMVGEIARLRSNTRWLMAALAAVSLLVVAVAGTAYVARNAAEDARNAVEAVVKVAEMQTVDREATTLSACRTRNGAARQTRESFAAAYDALENIVPNSKEAIDDLRATIPEQKVTDRDCDFDGEFTTNDYP